MSNDTSKKTKQTKTSNTKPFVNEMSNKVIKATGASSTQIEDELIQNMTTNDNSAKEDSE